MVILSDNIKSSDEIAALTDVAKQTYFDAEASAVRTPFLILAGSLLLLAFLIGLVHLPKILGDSNNKGGYGIALSNNKLLLGALGIFVYVGAEVSIGSFLVNYFIDMDMAANIKDNSTMYAIASFFLGSTDLSSIDTKGIVGAFVFFYWTGATVGRFIGAGLTRVVTPGKVLAFLGCVP